MVVVDLYYPVGSFDEPPGLSGLAHFVEHMLFKGTERFPKGQIDRLVTAAAGQCNAETGEDSTHYWFTFPSERWELALAIEADRMCHARFDPGEVELERRVIGEERARELNSPQGRLDQNHLAVTYLRHPYRNPILGWPDDIARIGVDDLTDFYRQHYRPDGAVLVVVGDVDGRTGPGPDRRRTSSGIPAGAGPAHAAVRSSSRASPAVATSRCSSPSGVARGSSAGAPCRGAIPTSPRSTSSPICFAAVGGRGSGSPWSRTRPMATWVEAAHATAQRAGQFFIQVEAESEDDLDGDRAARSSTSCAAWRMRARRPRSWPVRGAGSRRPGAGNRTTWRAWPPASATRRSGATGGPGRPSIAPRWPSSADEIRRVAAAYLDEPGLTVGWSLAPTPMAWRAT